MILATPGGAPPVYAVDLILNKNVFGPNEAIIVGLGNVTSGCRDPFGIPVSDFYIVPSGSATPGVRLPPLDPAGRPNTLTRSVFGATIGFTLPTGKIGNGDWAIVEDRCQDGFFNPGPLISQGDTVLDVAFRVELPVVLPPLDLGIQLDKNKALGQALH